MKILGFYKERGHVVNYTILLALASTGARIQELCTARVKDLHYEGKYWLKVTGKGDKMDEIPVFINQRGYTYNSKTIPNQVTDMIKKDQLRVSTVS